MPSSIAVRPDSAVAYISCRQTGGILEVNLAKPAEPTRTLPIASQAVALSPGGAVLYSAGGIWGGSTVDIIDTATMKACGYVAAEGPAAVATVPGIVPDLGCVPKPGG
jgi:DNA-binding beta-propeller fold protein YncE